MIQVHDVIDEMERWAPSSLAESWDNAGLMTGSPDDTIASILVTLDITEEILDSAIGRPPSLIISHHPPVFKPLKNLAGSSHSTRILSKAVRENVAIYVAHTNLDRAPDGVSEALTQKLGLKKTVKLSSGICPMVKFVTYTPPDSTDRVREAAGKAGAGHIGEYSICSFVMPGTGTFQPSTSAEPYEGETGKLSRVGEDRLEMIVPELLVPRVIESVRRAHPYEEMAYDLVVLNNRDETYGYGAVGILDEPVEESRFPVFVAERLGLPSVRVSNGGNRGRMIQRVAAMGGSGKDFIPHAIGQSADVYVTGGIGHHDYIDYGDGIMLIDATHRGTELPVLGKIQRRLLSTEWGSSVTIDVEEGSAPVTVITN